ncbi:PIN domain-containing protein [Cronbergia sp. UHCC 0137]|uniref:type II toxin-antitoxin system VapC family toxin n=1 Tax=Cronbergia sp. UHCC 0137 TaxID=3110239 RepID=UPI002B1F1089|nr:PIN domain-containing protein [Cronbergia sp. UHCC 0137]MEA5619334.1 PIN domain-containing protein [Cronbergia sp. UHCC 0137]
MRAIIADTGPLYAAIDVDDQYHQRSQIQIQRINAENLTILVPFPVYLETYNLLLYRLGTEQAIKFARDCIESVYFINPSQEQYIAAAEKAARFPDQKITLCDAVTAILSEDMKLQVWTYDYHFDIMKVQVWR